MEAVYAALIALGSAVVVKVLDWVFTLKSKRDDGLSDIRQSVRQIQEDLKALREEMLEEKANQNRQQILRFSDDLSHGQEHSKEYYDEILDAIGEYEIYASTHPEYRNNKTGAASKNVLKLYDEHLYKGDFLR